MRQTLILTLKVTFHMLLVTHVHVTSNKYAVTSNKKHSYTEAMFPFGYKILFFLKLPCEQSNQFNYNDNEQPLQTTTLNSTYLFLVTHACVDN